LTPEESSDELLETKCARSVDARRIVGRII